MMTDDDTFIYRVSKQNMSEKKYNVTAKMKTCKSQGDLPNPLKRVLNISAYMKKNSFFLTPFYEELQKKKILLKKSEIFSDFQKVDFSNFFKKIFFFVTLHKKV